MNERHVGSYRLLRMLNSGQNCQVWEAFHDAKQQRFAVKMLHGDRQGNREQIAFMRHEFAVASGLDDPRVVKMFEMGSWSGGPFLVMEFCPYPNMKYRLQQGIEPWAPRLPEVIAEAAAGLGYFHSRGWVHRDIKPENFLLSDDCDVKLVDFALSIRSKSGLARLFSRKSKIQGTRSYMSPEQIRGQPLDQRSDIYSFGCTIYELLCGRAPFTGSDTNELFSKHLRSPAPSMEVLNRNVTPEFARLVQRMLSKNRDDRPASMENVLSAYRAIETYREPPRPAKVSVD